MLKKSKNKTKRRNTETSIFFPNEPSVPQNLADGESGPLILVSIFSTKPSR